MCVSRLRTIKQSTTCHACFYIYHIWKLTKNRLKQITNALVCNWPQCNELWSHQLDKFSSKQQIPKCEEDKYKKSIWQICSWQTGNLFKTGADLRWLWATGDNDNHDGGGDSILLLLSIFSIIFVFLIITITTSFSTFPSSLLVSTQGIVHLVMCILSQRNIVDLHRQILLIFGWEIQV